MIVGNYTSTKTKKSERYDSSYELRRFKALDSSKLVKTWTRNHGLKLLYRIGKRRHRYNPDILVEYHDGRMFLEEVKGYVHDRLAFGAKNLIAVSYCKPRGIQYRIIFKEQLDLVD